MIGQTKDVGFQVGVSKTLPHSVDEVWARLTSDDGLALWLGEDVALSPDKGTPYETADGTRGEIRSFHDRYRIRLTWRPKDWDHDTTLQLTFTGGSEKTRLGIHQEWLAGPEERERQRTHWKRVMAKITQYLVG